MGAAAAPNACTFVGFALGLAVATLFGVRGPGSTSTRGLRVPVEVGAGRQNAGVVVGVDNGNSPPSRLGERWAVVQNWDCRKHEHLGAALSTHEALLGWGPDGHPRVEHVVLLHQCPCNGVETSVKTQRATKKASWKNYGPLGRHVDLLVNAGIRVVHTEDVASAASVLSVTGLTKFKEFETAFAHRKPGRGFKAFYAKLWAWNLTEYDRILYLDHDVIPTQDMTAMLARSAAEEEAAHTASSSSSSSSSSPSSCKGTMWAARDAPGQGVGGGCYNSGVMVLKPSQSDFQAMLRLLAAPHLAAAANSSSASPPYLSACEGGSVADARQSDTDQDFLQLYFQSRGCLLDMPPLFNQQMVTHREDLKNGFFGSVFLTWLLSTPATRRLAVAFHVVYPKTHLFIWNHTDAGKRYYEPPSGGKLTAPQAAFLAVFKTHWHRYRAALDRVCKALLGGGGAAMRDARLGSVRDVGGSCTRAMIDGLDQGDLAAWCESTEGTARFLFEREEPSMTALLDDPRVPLWADTL